MSKQFFYLIDIVRYFAALAVLFWHYQHFISVKADSPLYTVFWPFYEYGDLSVHLFWIISGFVFTNVYLKYRVSIKEFFISRFARLYPLHVVTLVVVACLQAASLKYLGEFQIYPYNDVYHFILNLLFIPEWGLQAGRSFNAPVWSVSVELFIYIIFILVLPFIMLFRSAAVFLLIVTMALLYSFGVPGSSFWLCGSFFFIGTLLYLLYVYKSKYTKIVYLGSIFVAFFIMSQRIALEMVVFSALMVAINHIEILAKNFASSLPRLGDLSYGIYLWHIPVQLVLLLAVSLFGITTEVFNTVTFLTLYLVIVNIMAYVGFIFIEKPSRNYIRDKYKNF